MQVLKFKHSAESKVFFFSDFHAGHERDFILGPRGFKTAEEAKEALIKNWNEKVSNNDTVFLLGDTVVGAGTHGLEVFNELLRRLNYKAIYIFPGNHTSGYSAKFDEVIANTSIDNYFRLTFSLDGVKTVHLVPNYFEIIVDKQFIVLSHYPILSYNNVSSGAICCFGHCHNNLTKSELGKIYLKGKVMDMGPESAGNYPLSFDEIMIILNKKEVLKIDHHL